MACTSFNFPCDDLPRSMGHFERSPAPPQWPDYCSRQPGSFVNQDNPLPTRSIVHKANPSATFSPEHSQIKLNCGLTNRVRAGVEHRGGPEEPEDQLNSKSARSSSEGFESR